MKEITDETVAVGLGWTKKDSGAGWVWKDSHGKWPCGKKYFPPNFTGSLDAILDEYRGQEGAINYAISVAELDDLARLFDPIFLCKALLAYVEKRKR